VASAGALYALLMVPVLLPGLALYFLTLRRLVRGRRGEARVVAVATAPLAVILLAPSLLVQLGPGSIPWIAAGTLSLGLLARLPHHG
jgi:fatty acid desaturase